MEPNPPTPSPDPSGSRDADLCDAILVLLDVVGYTFQVGQVGSAAAKQFDQHFADELKARAGTHGFRFIKPIGDAALLWGEQPADLVGLLRELFRDNPIEPQQRSDVWARLSDPDAADPQKWLVAWRRENILLPSGRDHPWPFIPSFATDFNPERCQATALQGSRYRDAP
jgi:hypothetical protein